MRPVITLLLLLLAISGTAQDKKPKTFFSFGIDYPMEFVDVEDASPGPGFPIARGDYGELAAPRFWKALSLHAGIGAKTAGNWRLSFIAYTRYNQNHYDRYPTRFIPPDSIASTNPVAISKIKFDLFTEAEKKLSVRKKQEKYFIILAGLGFTNINSGTDLFYEMQNGSGGKDTLRYKGSQLHFGPKFGLGYQYKRVKGLLEAYVTEDEDHSNLTALWIRLRVSYELPWKKKK